MKQFSLSSSVTQTYLSPTVETCLPCVTTKFQEILRKTALRICSTRKKHQLDLLLLHDNQYVITANEVYETIIPGSKSF